MNKWLLSICLLILPCIPSQMSASAGDVPIMVTGGQEMPDQWIDQDTGYRVVKLSKRSGSNRCFYFHNNPFVENEMIFHGAVPAPIGVPTSPGMGNVLMQMFAVNLNTFKIRQLTNELYDVDSEVLCARTKELFYQHKDTVFSLNVKKMSRRIVAVMPKNLSGIVYTVNCNGTLLAGVLDCPELDSLLARYPNKNEHFRIKGLSTIKRTIFTIDIRSGEVKIIFTEGAWLSHLQFSPTKPSLLMFCHEGPWHEVNRIWTIDVLKRDSPRLIHKRSINNEIAGHEWWGMSGKNIYFDLQKPVGKKFYIGKVDIRSGKLCAYELQRDEWSTHFNSSSDEMMFAGDGGAENSVAASRNGRWIYIYNFQGAQLRSSRLVNMIKNDYKVEPNVHFSSGHKWVIFQANFEGKRHIYAVETKKHKHFKPIHNN